MNLFESTCVILISDHGMYLGEHKRAGKHTVDRSDPWPLHDEVAKIPLLVWLPTRNRPETVNALCQPADILPTVLDYAGVPKPACVGRSWEPLLTGKSNTNHEMLFSSCHSGNKPGSIKYLTSLIRVMDDRHIAHFGPDTFELYRYDDDTYRSYSQVAPDPATVSRLSESLASFMREQGGDDEYIRNYVSKGNPS